MPSYADSLSAQEMWGLAYYVQSLSKRPTGPAPKENATITSKFIKADLSTLDPTSPVWKKAPGVDILLRPLWFKEGYVDRVRVRSLHNGKEIAFLLEWENSTKNADIEKLEPPRLVLARALKRDHTKSADTPRLEAFGDAVALQFPVKTDGLPPFPMGEAGQVVNIWQWRAARNGQGSVENLAAAGFGTLTTQLSQDVKGRGNWRKSKWRIAFSRAMAGGDEAVGLAPGKVVPVAFAVWNGAINQRDGEKSVSTWAFLKIEAPSKGE
jgi:DMSO reductase family type II enzyme heme b subunit